MVGWSLTALSALKSYIVPCRKFVSFISFMKLKIIILFMGIELSNSVLAAGREF